MSTTSEVYQTSEVCLLDHLVVSTHTLYRRSKHELKNEIWLVLLIGRSYIHYCGRRVSVSGLNTENNNLLSPVRVIDS